MDESTNPEKAIEQIDDKSYHILKPVFPMRLPCGYVDPKTNALLDEFGLYRTTGFEEDILTDDSLTASESMNTVVARCLSSVGDRQFKRAEERSSAETNEVKSIVQGLLVSDRAFILHMLRWFSNRDGHIVRVKRLCPIKVCGEDFVSVLDLRTVTVTPMADPAVRVHKFTLPDSGRTVTFKHLQVKDELGLIRLMEAHGDSSGSVALWCQIQDVDGVKIPHHRDLRMWSSMDRDALREESQRLEGGMDMEDVIACPKCKMSQRVPRQLDASFFFPSHVNSGRKRTT